MNLCQVCEVPCEGKYCDVCTEWNALNGAPPAELLEATARRVDMAATAEELKRSPLSADVLRRVFGLLGDTTKVKSPDAPGS